jgi:hypothetical protein
VTKVGDVYELTLTAEVRQLLSQVYIVVSLGLGSSESLLTCLGLDGFLARLVFWMVVPLGLAAASFLYVLAFLSWQRCYSHAALVEKALPLVLVTLFVMYPIVANVAFEAFSCCASPHTGHTLDASADEAADSCAMCVNGPSRCGVQMTSLTTAEAT